MAFPAFLDTCVLFPQYLNDTLLTEAGAGTFRPLWSRDVLDELGRALARETRMTEEQVGRRLHRMSAAFPDAEVLVTFNLKDFPESALEHVDITAVHPDEFLLDQLDLYPAVVIDCLHEQVTRYTKSAGPREVSELLVPLTRAGVPRFADEVRRHLL